MIKRICYVIFFLVFILVTQVVPTHADSGWDGSYGGGGSSSSGGSISSGSSDSSSSSGSSKPSTPIYSWGTASTTNEDIDMRFEIFFTLGIIGIFLFFILVNLGEAKKKNTKQNSFLVVPFAIEKIKQVLPNFDKKVFKQNVFSIYQKIQVAWMNFDYETLRKYTTDELYNLYHSQLVALQMKKQKNVMRNFSLTDFAIVGMEKVENTVALKVRMRIKCLDYIVDEKNKIIRGTDRQKMVYDYEMTFVKGMDIKKNKCPNCNAPLENVNRSVCPYCDSVIISENYDWVLAKKQMINQFRK